MTNRNCVRIDRVGIVAAAATLVLMLAALPATAHHSFAVHFVADKIVHVTGVVTEFSFRNPHGVITLAVDGSDGKSQEWKAETNSPNILRRRGWSEKSIKPGDRITVEGYPSRDGANYLRLSRATFPDGRVLVGQRPDPTAPSGAD